MYISHKFFIDAINNIAEDIVDSGIKYDYICGIVRGGLIPATALSYKLKIPMITINFSTRDADKQDISDETFSLFKSGKKILLVDDIIDSGLTLEKIHNKLDVGYIDRAALVYNTAQPFKCDYSHFYIDRNVMKNWIVFWWDDGENE